MSAPWGRFGFHRSRTIGSDNDEIRKAALQPGAQQRHVGGKGEQQPQGERELDPPAEDVEIGSHGLTIRRF